MKNDFPKRKHPRLKDYDYSTLGAYFITICVKAREQLLGKFVGCGDFDAPKILLSEYGKILDKYIKIMDSKYPYIQIDQYVIMPNHFHFIVNITDYQGGASETAAPYNHTIPKFVSLLKRFCNMEYGENIWQRSYHDHIIRDENDYKKIREYIDNNVMQWEMDCFYEE